MFVKSSIKKMLLLIGVTSSLLMGSEKNNALFKAEREDGVVAKYLGRDEMHYETNKPSAVYLIQVLSSDQHAIGITRHNHPVIKMHWNDEGALHVELSDGTQRTYPLAID